MYIKKVLECPCLVVSTNVLWWGPLSGGGVPLSGGMVIMSDNGVPLSSGGVLLSGSVVIISDGWVLLSGSGVGIYMHFTYFTF